MTLLVVNYDLRQPGRNYQPLWDRLAAWKAVRGLESMWIVSTSATPEQLRDDLRNYVDGNDGLFVAAFGQCAWWGLSERAHQYLNQQLVPA